jgi:hypothetical protein
MRVNLRCAAVGAACVTVAACSGAGRGGLERTLSFEGLAPAGSNAQIVSTTIPAQLVAGGRTQVAVQVKNTGTVPWVQGQGWMLHWVPGTPFFAWADSAVPATVMPGATTTFQFSILPPTGVSSANFVAQMVVDQNQTGGFFGARLDLPIAIVSGTLPLDAALVSSSIPSTLVAGQTVSANVTVKNTGTSTWSAGGSFLLYGRNSPLNAWGPVDYALDAAVDPRGVGLFQLRISAPAAGPYPAAVEFQMYEVNVGFFGPVFNFPVTVSATPPDAGVPDAIVAQIPDAATGDTGLGCSLGRPDAGYGPDAGPVQCGNLNECECLGAGFQPLCRPDYCSDCNGGRIFVGCGGRNDPVPSCPVCPATGTDAGVDCHGRGPATCASGGGGCGDIIETESDGTSWQGWGYCISPNDPSNFSPIPPFIFPPETFPPNNSTTQASACYPAGHAVFTSSASKLPVGTGEVAFCGRGLARCWDTGPIAQTWPNGGPESGLAWWGVSLPDCKWPFVPSWTNFTGGTPMPEGCVLASDCPGEVLCAGLLGASGTDFFYELGDPELFPMVDKSCNVDADCTVGLHTLGNPCSITAVGMNASALSSFSSAETTCRAQLKGQRGFASSCSGLTWVSGDDISFGKSGRALTRTSTMIHLSCIENTCRSTIF